MFKAFGASDVGLGFCFVSVDEKRWGFFLPNVLKSLDTDFRESDRWALCGLLGDRTQVAWDPGPPARHSALTMGAPAVLEGVSSWQELPSDDNGTLLRDTR